MIRSMRCAAAAAIMLVLCLGLCLSASAASFPDVEGHWAQNTLLEASEKGWLTGFEDGTMRPDEPATDAQVATILCRILDAQYGSGTGEWYADAAAKAAELGLVYPGEIQNAPLTRQRALRMVEEAFQLHDAGEDTSCLDAFSDTVLLPGADRLPLAALVNKGYVSGYDNALHLSDNLTRAEFCAVLSRILKDGGICLDGSVSGWTGNTLWIGCSSGDVHLENVKADTVVVRTQGLRELTVEECEIGTLVLACDGELSLEWPEGTALRVGGGSGLIQLNGKAGRLSVTGGGRMVCAAAAPTAVYISGAWSSVILSDGAQRAVINGSDSKLTTGGLVGELEINAENVTVDGTGSVTAAVVRAPGASLPAGTDTTEDIDRRLDGATVHFTHPDTLPAGEMLQAGAEVENAPAGLSGWMTWLVDGETVKSEPVTLGQNITMEHWYTYSRDMSPTSHITFRFDYITRYGKLQSLSGEFDQWVENYDQSYFDELDYWRMINLVTGEYAGDGTLEWAYNNDYTTEDKEDFVRAMGYESSSQYLIWINKTYQRVNIFEGEKGNWKLIQSGLVATGAGDNPANNLTYHTPTGVWKITMKQTEWRFNTYICRPIVRFYGGGFAMHSRLYAYSGDLYDATIGVPASHGCVRMMDEQIYWIYNNAPVGTTVVVY